MLNDRSTPLALLATRRSGRPRDMAPPGPNADELAQILSIAARTPDHGKLHPWRFIHVPQARRGPSPTCSSPPTARAGRADRGQRGGDHPARLPGPRIGGALFSPKPSAKIPLWEQQLSCGAACMNLEHAAHALGYAAGWITGWAAYSDIVRNAFGAEPERIAGFFYIGTPGMPLEERVRPDLSRVVSIW
jgi:nitroreductase